MSRRPHSIRQLPPAVALLLAAAATPLQAQSPTNVLALSDSTPVLARITPGLCTQSTCAPAIPSILSSFSGGVAHDPGDRATWICDGTTLLKVDPRNACNVVCPAMPVPGLPAGVEVTGLAYDQLLRQLYISRSDNQLDVFQASVCALTFLSTCALPVPTNHIVSGLAVDEVTGRLFYASSPWNGPGGPTEINVSLQSNPCTPICPPRVPVGSSGVVPDITGLGYDACRQTLVYTDSIDVYDLQVTGLCGFTAGSSCPGVTGELLTGLCILPSTEVTTGPSCFNGTAPNCPTMQHSLRGDPAIGNLTFSLDLANFPGPSLALCLMDVGTSCNAANFGLCQFVPSIPIWSSLTVHTAGGCTGFASLLVALPPNASLCGVILSSRWAGWMFPGGPADHFVSECQTWMITST